MLLRRENRGRILEGKIEECSQFGIIALIGRNKLTGTLTLENKSGGAVYNIPFMNGAPVGLFFNGEMVGEGEKSQRKLVSAIVRRSPELFYHSEGNFRLNLWKEPQLQRIQEGLLPLPFFLRFALSKSWESSKLLKEIFRRVFPNPTEIKIEIERDVLELLGDSKGELRQFIGRVNYFDPLKNSPPLNQMALICWGLGYLQFLNPPPIERQFQEISEKLLSTSPDQPQVIPGLLTTRPSGANEQLDPFAKVEEDGGEFGELELEQEAELFELEDEEGRTILVSPEGEEFELELGTGSEQSESSEAREYQTRKLSPSPTGPSEKSFEEEREPSLKISERELMERTVNSEAATKFEVTGVQPEAKGYNIVELFLAMKKWGASDLFITEGKVPAIRLHGKVLPLDLPETDRGQLESFLNSILSEKNIEKFRKEGDLDVGYSPDSESRFRLNIHRQMGRISMTVRALPSGELDFEELGLPEVVRDLASEQRGLILVAGTTGSGKSTTLAAIIHYINKTRDAHIVTIEDPIEFVHKEIRSRITQREVGSDTASFHSALRHVVRESPDVIMIGEMRDRETMEVAISAALTGHLVLSTLHTVDSVQTVQRILSYFPEHLQQQICTDLSLSLKGIIAQRLVPTADGEGRVLAAEVLKITPAAAQLLRQQKVEELHDLLEHSSEHGLISFNRSLLELYREGKISYEVGRAYASNPDQFTLATQGMELGARGFGTVVTKAVAELDLKSLLQITLEKGASDLHLTVGRPPILRIDGKLQPLPLPPLSDGDMRTLLFSTLTTPQRTIYQLEKELDFALSLEDGKRFRINAYFQKGKMAASMRAIPSEVPDPRKMSIPETVLQLSDAPHGLLLVTGPTGSGKTTTLACMIQRINKTRACRIITIEDPIEFIYKSEKATIDQRELYADTKSFASALKYILRQDPDVILIGELRDLETISSALTAAETGHLVLASLHTNDAVQTVDRIIDVFPSHQQEQVRSQLAASLLGVVSQRLLPRKGRRGRIPAFEIMLATPAIRNLIREDKMHQAKTIIESSKRMGMITMDTSLRDLYAADLITYQDAMRYITNPQILDAVKK